MHLSQVLLLIVITIWSLRLGLYLFFRLWGKAEDWRYAELKTGWGKNWLWQSYVKVFILQGILLILCSSTLWYGFIHLNKQFSFINWLGFLLWAIGFTLESYADYYLKKFKAQNSNKGKFCQSGPWKFCRFPNYLGEITLWWGVYLIVFNSTTWWTFISPLLLNLFIIYFSGIPYLERRLQMKNGYAEYAKKVPRLLPVFLK